jgi:hypothetical protein
MDAFLKNILFELVVAGPLRSNTYQLANPNTTMTANVAEIMRREREWLSDD